MPNEVTAGKTYLELIQSSSSAAAKPLPPKSKRERADDNWKILDGLIIESEKHPKGSAERAKVLERLHVQLRALSKRPRTDFLIKDGKKVLRCEYTSAQDEWVDFLAPDCSMCGVSVQAGCSCDQLAQEADCFMTDGDVHVGSVETSSGSTSRCSP
ncbi:hypothetical protein T484DRAFT_1880029 [Baffinella frigidus]|nr:hypothetical protein T484DRAFT_1880029 [Cryptophyta sp. CCMP2293]|mmetsp:Transcript_50637/g.120592  ORF Transcript_50637/g.120592 Transcript_50637/m.120592 type:complete len:156 (-) Transcript_50637:264-731(-)